MEKRDMIQKKRNYELLVNQEIMNKDFNTHYHKKVNNIVFLTILLGGLFTWFNSSPESNIYKLLMKLGFGFNESNSVIKLLVFPILTISFV